LIAAISSNTHADYTTASAAERYNDTYRFRGSITVAAYQNEAAEYVPFSKATTDDDERSITSIDAAY